MSDSPGFVPGITYLTGKYMMRKIRGDGNCFYRAFLFSYLEQLLRLHSTLPEVAEVERKRFETIVLNSKDELVSLGFSEIAIETFHDVSTDSLLVSTLTRMILQMFVELIAGIFPSDTDALVAMFQEDGQSDYYVWFMRLLTSGHTLPTFPSTKSQIFT